VAFTYNIGTPSGIVRQLISDVDAAHPIFDDAEIAVFLRVEGNNELRAAALALTTIAGNQAMVLKVIQEQGLQTDGAKLSAELRALADKFLARATATVEASGGVAISFVPVTYGSDATYDEFGRPDRWCR